MTFMYEGKEYNFADIIDITWGTNARTPQSFRTADIWTVEFDDGSKLDVDPTQLDDEDKTLFTFAAFPG